MNASWAMSSSWCASCANRAAMPNTLRLCRRTSSAKDSSSPASVDWMRSSSVGAAGSTCAGLLSGDAVGNASEHGIDEVVGVRLHVLDFLQLLRRQHLAHLLRDVGARDGQV